MAGKSIKDYVYKIAINKYDQERKARNLSFLTFIKGDFHENKINHSCNNGLYPD